MNKTEFYSPTQDDVRLAESMLTDDMRKMSEERANGFQEKPNYIERGQVWSVNNPDGKELGDIVVWMATGGKDDKEANRFEKENPCIQGFLITEDTKKATESDLILREDKGVFNRQCVINAGFNGRFLLDQLKEYKGFIGENNVHKLTYVFLANMFGTEGLEKRFSGTLETGSEIENENDPRIKFIHENIEKLNGASSKFDRGFFEFIQFEEEEYRFIKQIEKDILSENVSTNIEDYINMADNYGFEIPKKLLNKLKRKVILKNIKAGDSHVAKELMKIEKIPLKAIEKELKEILAESFRICCEEKTQEIIDELGLPESFYAEILEKQRIEDDKEPLSISEEEMDKVENWVAENIK